LAHARLALQAASEIGRPVLLLSAPYAAGTVGPGWFQAVIAEAATEFNDMEIEAMLDCGDRAGYALAALRQGITHIRFEGKTKDKVTDIANQLGAQVSTARPDSLDLYALEIQGESLDKACRDWLLEVD
tara:strand:+ start:442 stop:828 length:387 start_codon:yes stop_codon:yes gene_type:complete